MGDSHFWAKLTEPDENGCRIWTGYIDRDGYGKCWYRGRKAYVHRAAYLDVGGLIPERWQVDHLCRVRACAEPTHLEAVPASVNVRRSTAPAVTRARAQAVTECPKGHSYTPENTYRYPDGRRKCRTCGRAEAERYRALKRAA